MGDLAGGRAPLDGDGEHEAVHLHDVARIAEAVRVVVDAHAALISRVLDDEWLEIIAVAGTVHGPDPTGTRWRRADLDRHLAEAERQGGIHVTTRRAVADVDVPDEAAFAAGGSSILLVPLHSEGHLLGVLATIGYVDLAQLPAGVSGLVELYADQARLAIELQREHQLLLEHLRLSDAAQSLLYVALEQTDEPSLLASVAESVGDLMGARAAWVCTAVGSGLVSQARQKWASHPPSVSDRLGAELCTLLEPLVATCWSQAQALSERESPVLARIGGLLDESRVLLAAIGSGAEARGALLVARGDDDGAWTPQERDALAGLGHSLGWVSDQLERRRRDRHLVAELKEVDQHRRDLVASLTHDLKTPLTAISLNAQLLETDASAEAGAQPVAAIRRSAERLSSLVDDLLALARAEESVTTAGASSDISPPADAVDLIREACRHAEVEAQQRRVHYRLDLPDRLMVAVDGSALARVYVNVVDNAVKYSLPGGEVRITLREVDGQVEMRCADDGIGIAEPDQASVFDMFRRARDSDARGVPGSGVGLAISRRIVTRLGGSIELVSDLGEGTTFVVRVPGASLL